MKEGSRRGWKPLETMRQVMLALDGRTEKAEVTNSTEPGTLLISLRCEKLSY